MLSKGCTMHSVERSLERNPEKKRMYYDIMEYEIATIL